MTICSPRISPLIHGYFFSVSDDRAGDEDQVRRVDAVGLLVLGLELLADVRRRVDMSTSIALVTCAAVSSERRMCSAIPRRIAFIGSSIAGCGGPAGSRAQGAEASAALRPWARVRARGRDAGVA